MEDHCGWIAIASTQTIFLSSKLMRETLKIKKKNICKKGKMRKQIKEVKIVNEVMACDVLAVAMFFNENGNIVWLTLYTLLLCSLQETFFKYRS